MERDIKLSNIKGLLIFLVVFGHIIEVYKEDYYKTFLLIYSFHMPLFVFISGYLAKHIKFKKIMNFIWIYLFFQTFFYMVDHLTIGKYEFGFDYYMVPFFQLWYVISIIFWYAIAATINKLNVNQIAKIFVLILSIIISVVSRFYTEEIVDIGNNIYPLFYSYTFSIQRTLTFLPYFLLGLFINDISLQKLYQSLRFKILFLTLLMFSFFIILKIVDRHDIEFLFRGSYGIETIKESGIPIYLKVLISYVFSISMCYFFMNIINGKKSILTKWGDNSLSIFLFHPIIVLILKKDTNIMHYGVHKNAVILFVLSVIVVLILGSNWFSKISNRLCNPIKYLRMRKQDMPNERLSNVLKVFKNETNLQ